jgi:hypothetical protein
MRAEPPAPPASNSLQRSRGDWRPLALWSLFVLLLAGLLLLWEDDPLQLGLLAGAGAAMLAAGVLVALYRPRRQPLAGSSWSTVLLALGATALVLGALFGAWLLLPGAGLAALGAGGLIREAR